MYIYIICSIWKITKAPPLQPRRTGRLPHRGKEALPWREVWWANKQNIQRGNQWKTVGMDSWYTNVTTGKWWYYQCHINASEFIFATFSQSITFHWHYSYIIRWCWEVDTLLFRVRWSPYMIWTLSWIDNTWNNFSRIEKEHMYGIMSKTNTNHITLQTWKCTHWKTWFQQVDFFIRCKTNNFNSPHRPSHFKSARHWLLENPTVKMPFPVVKRACKHLLLVPSHT